MQQLLHIFGYFINSSNLEVPQMIVRNKIHFLEIQVIGTAVNDFLSYIIGNTTLYYETFVHPFMQRTFMVITFAT